METTTTTPTRPAPKPKWLRVKLPTGKKYTELRGLVEQYKRSHDIRNAIQAGVWQGHTVPHAGWA